MATGAPVTVKVTLAVVVLTPLMAWVAVTVTGPGGSSAAGVTVQVPSPAMVSCPMVVPDWSVRVTTAPEVPVPVMAGCWLAITAPAAGAVMATGASGTVKATLSAVLIPSMT